MTAHTIMSLPGDYNVSPEGEVAIANRIVLTQHLCQKPQETTETRAIIRRWFLSLFIF